MSSHWKANSVLSLPLPPTAFDQPPLMSADYNWCHHYFRCQCLRHRIPWILRAPKLPRVWKKTAARLTCAYFPMNKPVYQTIFVKKNDWPKRGIKSRLNQTIVGNQSSLLRSSLRSWRTGSQGLSSKNPSIVVVVSTHTMERGISSSIWINKGEKVWDQWVLSAHYPLFFA